MSLEVKRLVVGQLQTNCYLVYSDQDEEVLIIDPGDDAEYIIRTLEELNKKPTKIIATHGHFDHILAAFELVSGYDIPFCLNKKDEFLLDRAQQSAGYFLGIKTDPLPPVNEYLKEGLEINLGNHIFRVLETPGHTPGGISLYSEKENIVLAGDLVFEQGGLGRTDFAYSNNNNFKSSVKKLLTLPDRTTVYPGHGNRTSIANVKKSLNF